MKVVILAGGNGTRISEETHLKPKPMIEIGDRPILLHIMEQYAMYGFEEFVVCLGYKGYAIKEYFAHYYLQASDVTFDFRANNEIMLHNQHPRPWLVTLAETGKDTMTGGRIKRIRNYVGGQTFMLTYGDGIADINLAELLEFHQSHGKWATITAVQPAGRFGALRLSGNQQVTGFEEKPLGDGGWVNGGFFVLQPEVFDLIDGDASVWEQEPLRRLTEQGQLMAYKHAGFWHAMDTLRDKNHLEKLWHAGELTWPKA